MGRVVLLDAGPLGMVAGPRLNPGPARCQRWARGLLSGGVRIVVPEVADYEIGRELLRRGATAGIVRLDLAVAGLEFAPITREVMLRAAELWAGARRGGYPTASDNSLDADVILAATALLIGQGAHVVRVATTNVSHLGRFPGVDAREWDTIA